MENKSRGAVDFTLILFILLLATVGFFAYQNTKNKTQNAKPETESSQLDTQTTLPTPPFTFTAAGDFANGDTADAVLRGIADAKSAFTLALGDLGYAGNGTEPAWCDFVKSKIGNDHPFELIAGNHDDGSKDGNINEYAKCLPNKLENIVGDYGIEYYFDYQNLARFILISPDINNYGFDYVNGGEHLQWVIDMIDSARSEGIKWVVVGMHKNCITPGIKECEIGDDLLNTLVDLKVDIVLQGHEHAYFRSKQLALNPETCPAIIVNEFNESCIAQTGDQLKKGQGTVIVISGAGGYKLREVNSDDKEYNYFTAFNGSNVGDTYGFSLFKVTKNEIKASFVPAVGTFTDAFSIR